MPKKIQINTLRNVGITISPLNKSVTSESNTVFFFLNILWKQTVTQDKSRISNYFLQKKGVSKIAL